MTLCPRRFVPLRPAGPRPPPLRVPRVTFYDLPAELRIEIYKLALHGVTIHILPRNAAEDRKIPHPLTRTSRQVRLEVLPLIHAQCPIQCTVTDFNFDGLLAWMNRVPPDQEKLLLKNDSLSIILNTVDNRLAGSQVSLRHWLHMRADKHRPHPRWQYRGPTPHPKICADLKRRAKRMPELRKREEMLAILEALGVHCSDGLRLGPSSRSRS